MADRIINKLNLKGLWNKGLMCDARRALGGGRLDMENIGIDK